MVHVLDVLYVSQHTLYNFHDSGRLSCKDNDLYLYIPLWMQLRIPLWNCSIASISFSLPSIIIQISSIHNLPVIKSYRSLKSNLLDYYSNIMQFYIIYNIKNRRTNFYWHLLFYTNIYYTHCKIFSCFNTIPLTLFKLNSFTCPGSNIGNCLTSSPNSKPV